MSVGFYKFNGALLWVVVRSNLLNEFVPKSISDIEKATTSQSKIDLKVESQWLTKPKTKSIDMTAYMKHCDSVTKT